LAALFKDTTASYKHLFFNSILKSLATTDQNGSTEADHISLMLRKIGEDMVISAYPTLCHWHLSLGQADKMKRCLKHMGLWKDSIATTPKKIKEEILEVEEKVRSDDGADAISKNRILRFVPYKLLSPWLRGKVDLSGDPNVGQIYEITAREFDTLKPLYRTHPPNAPCEERCIVLHSDWAKYIRDNFDVIRSWADFHWLNYLQRRNPNAPSLVSKLWIPESNPDLGWSKKMVRLAFGDPPNVDCIYTNRSLAILGKKGELHLDHFLPRSWVGHDQLWNLAPVLGEINLSKSNRIPAEKFIDGLASLHCKVIRRLHERAGTGSWRKVSEEYLTGLRIDLSDPPFDDGKIRKAYRDIIKPQMNLAINSGFKPGWRPASEITTVLR